MTYVIAIGPFYDHGPRRYASARTLKAARSWLRAQGYTQKKPKHDERAYFENAERMEWARVVDAPDVSEADADD